MHHNSEWTEKQCQTQNDSARTISEKLFISTEKKKTRNANVC